jgi:glycoside/pentoside/hexuronide:cation symporter, GPH family
VTAVRIGFTVLPALLVLAAVPVFARYRLEETA